MKKRNNTTSLDDYLEKGYGKVGTSKRDIFEQGYNEFKVGAMLLSARLEKGMTQEELAKKLEQRNRIFH